MTAQDTYDCIDHYDLSDKDELILELEEKVDNLETEKETLEELKYGMELVLTGLLEQLIKDKTRRAKMYAKLANGETFEAKDSQWYTDRKSALESEIEGHRNTIKSMRQK